MDVGWLPDSERATITDSGDCTTKDSFKIQNFTPRIRLLTSLGRGVISVSPENTNM